MCFTSPPYNLGDNSKLRGWLGTGKDTLYENYDDKKTEADWLKMMIDFTKIMIAHCQYVFCNIQILAGNRVAMVDYWSEFKNQFCDLVIWNKEHAAPALAEKVMNSCFEFIFIFAKDNPTRAIRIAPEFRGTVNNVYNAAPNKSRQEYDAYHGAVFPNHLPTHFIKNFTQEKAVIVDPFSGTGTTLIACEQTGRTCYAMEIDPKYCDVIIKRYADLTGDSEEEIFISGEGAKSLHESNVKT